LRGFGIMPSGGQSGDELSLAGDVALAFGYLPLGLSKAPFQRRPIHPVSHILRIGKIMRGCRNRTRGCPKKGKL